MNTLSDGITINPAGALRVSQLTTLFDGKLIYRTASDTEFWNETAGNGGSFNYSSGNSVLMQVPAVNGAYAIRETTRSFPYFSGKPQDIEITFEQFKIQPNVIKRAGYFNSGNLAPYNTEIDGFYIESNGIENNYAVKSFNNDKETSFIDSKSFNWKIKDYQYDWDNFTVTLFTFLWLGGAAIDYSMVGPYGFEKLAGAGYAGFKKGTITRSPSKPIRYEIRSFGGAGSFNTICSQVATGGSVEESGRGKTIRNPIALAANNVNTTYVLLAIRKIQTRKEVAALITSIDAVIGATTDSGILTIAKNPVISGGSLVWQQTSDSMLEYAIGSSSLTTINANDLSSKSLTSSGLSDSDLKNNFLNWLTNNINGVGDTFALLYTPMTANQTVTGILNYRLY